ncbi:MAG: hypothetical protein ABJA81_02725 [Nocardioidaceae bacterium]
MSRADAYSAFYRAMRARLLHQVYAYCGDTEVAQHAVADAFVSAGHHWRKLVDDPDKDAWMREKAFRASTRSQNRGRKPWYVRALKTADEHRPVLAALQAMSQTDRRLVILVYLVGLDLPLAGSEAGVTNDAALSSIARSAAVFADQGVEASPEGIHTVLISLRHDLVDEPVYRASRLRREGNRRRHSHMGLAAICSLAVVIGAGALTAAQPKQVVSQAPTTPPPATPSQPKPTQEVDAAALAPLADVKRLDSPNPWKLTDTSTDFEAAVPYDECLSAVPSDRHARHFYVRTFQSGAGEQPTVGTESLEVSRSIQAADRNYQRLVTSFSACRADNHQILDYRLVRGVGDAASLVSLKYVDSKGIHTERIAIGQSGNTLTVWVVDSPNAKPVVPRQIVTLLASSVQQVCGLSKGSCSRRPYQVIPQVPPKIDRAQGFLTALDLPVFEGLTEPWVATSPDAVRDNPAATNCDRTDFVKAKATNVEARNFVVPSKRKLATIFGMTETKGVFSSMRRANSFVANVSKTVQGCHDRQLSLEVKSTQTIQVEQGTGKVWEVDVAASQAKGLTFRIALFRVGTTVAQVTFTPTREYDLTETEYISLARRAALRITQS